MNIHCRNAIEQRSQQLNLGLELGQPEMNVLIVEYALAKDLALPGVLDRRLNALFHAAN